MASVNDLRELIAYNVGDPSMAKANRDHILGFLNAAARDLQNSGWLIRHEDAENIALIANEFEYDVPANFAYVKYLALGDKNVDNASTVDTGTDIDGALSDTTGTSVTVDDGTIFVVNDLIQVDSEIMFITAIASNVLTVTRGYFGTTAATHLDDASILRPLADITYEHVIPRAYWQIKVQSGGANATTAALASRPQFVFNSNLFSFTGGTPVKVIGQRRPTSLYASGDTIDDQMESFLTERATAYTARFIYAQGDSPHLQQVYRDALAMSAEFFRRHPAEFRARPNSTLVPGR